MTSMPVSFNFLHHPKSLLIARLCLLSYFILIISLSLMPMGKEMPMQIWDKAAHAMAYVGFAAIATLCTLHHRHFLLYLAGFILFGASIEVAQGMTPYRSFSYADMLANSTGIALGYVLSLIINKILPLPCFSRR